MAKKPFISMNLKGLNLAVKDFREFGDEGEKKFEEITETRAREIVYKAKRAAPTNKGKGGGNLKGLIRSRQLKRLRWKVISGATYSPYVEFGTGAKNVIVPEELKTIANEFRGADPNRGNIRPQPFLYPAFVAVRPIYIKDLNTALNKLTKKHNE